MAVCEALPEAVVQVALTLYLGVSKMALDFCISAFIWRMLQRAPERVIAAVPAMPSGFRPEVPDLFYRNNMKNWAPAPCEKRPDVTTETLKKMYHENNYIIFSVTRDFVRGCTTLDMPWQRKLQCLRRTRRYLSSHGRRRRIEVCRLYAIHS